IAGRVEHLDVTTVLKVSHALSGEMVLEKLIDRLMRTAIEHAGAERGLLITTHGEKLQLAAEVLARGDDVIVHLTPGDVEMPESLIRYVIRLRETVLLDDVPASNSSSLDPYFSSRPARSILCLSLIRQGKLLGVLYLENKLASYVFTADRLTVLKVITS